MDPCPADHTSEHTTSEHTTSEHTTTAHTTTEHTTTPANTLSPALRKGRYDILRGPVPSYTSRLLDLLHPTPTTPDKNTNALWDLGAKTLSNWATFLTLAISVPSVLRAGSLTHALQETFTHVGVGYIFGSCVYGAVRSPLWALGFVWAATKFGKDGALGAVARV